MMRAAVFVATLIRYRRHELVQQIAVAAMQLADLAGRLKRGRMVGIGPRLALRRATGASAFGGISAAPSAKRRGGF